MKMNSFRAAWLLLITFFSFQVCFFVYMHKQIYRNDNKQPLDREDSELNKIHSKRLIEAGFDAIYAEKFWGDEKSGGSGLGSTLDYTSQTRNILYKVITRYDIKSMIDAPCGGMAWMPSVLTNVSSRDPSFRYMGVDIVQSVIDKVTERFASMPTWRFTRIDITQEPLPGDYDLIFSRDALQHLPYEKVVDALENFARTPHTRYLLVGSYLDSSSNKDIKVGDYFLINLIKQPFNLDGYIETFAEQDTGKKHLLLYDIPNYLKLVNFDQMRRNIKRLRVHN